MKKRSKLYAVLAVLLWFCAVTILTVLTIKSVIQQEIVLMIIAFISFVVGILLRSKLIGSVLILFSIGLNIILVALTPEFISILFCIGVGGISFWKFIEQSIKDKFMTNYNTVNIVSGHHGKVVKQKWMQPQDNVQQIYEWEDKNITSWFGDTTLHLGNTIMPEGTNVLMMNKVYGDVRLIVPLEVGVVIYHNTLHGNVLFEQENYALNNSSLTVYSNNYAQANKVIKIATTIYFGNLEVVQL